MAFSPTEAAFEGFRLTREKPVAVAWWVLVCFAFTLIIDVLMATLAGGGMTAFLANPAADPGPGMALFDLAAIPVLLGFSAVIACAAYRAVLGPGEARFGYLRLGADELRMFGLYAVLMLIWAGVFLAAFFAGAMVLALGSGAGAVGGMLAGGLAGGVVMAALVFFGVRLSLAGPMTFVERRLSLPDAWRMTRGRFWPLLSAYFLSWILALVVMMLGTAIFTALAALATGRLGAYGASSGLSVESLAEVFTPGRLFVIAASALLSALTNAIILAAPAVAYREFRGKPAA